MNDKKATSFAKMKQQNVKTVFRTVVCERPVSRADIALHTGLNKMTVTNCVKTLMDADLMVEKETAISPVGRPPILTDLNAAYGIVIGVELNIISCKIVISEFSGEVLERLIVSDIAEDPDRFVDYIASLTEREWGSAPYLHGLLGVGIAIPGNYNSSTGCVEYISNMQRWNGYPIREKMMEKLPNTLILLQNAARAEADGEMDFGNVGENEDIAYIYGAMGLALSMYSQGGMHVGHRGFNGRFGHNIIAVGGRKCTCGNHGCLEMYASVHSICSSLYPGSTVTDSMIRTMLSRRDKDDPEVRAALDECIGYLSVGLANVINNFNPSRVCIGSYLGILLEGREEELNREVNSYLLPHYREERKIFVSHLGEWGAALGSIATVRNQIFEHVMNQ